MNAIGSNINRYILILHGIKGYAGEYWQNWLSKQAEKLGYKVIMPDLPNAAEPNRGEWLKIISTATSQIEDMSKLTIVAHSLGVPSGLDFVQSLPNNVGIERFISVAGFYKSYGVELIEDFMQTKQIDMNNVISKVKDRYIIRSLNDPYVDQSALIELGNDLEANEIIIRDGQHFQHGEYIEKFDLLKFLISE